ncbi:hypothetical protein GCM10010282_37220 [Streptomyces roseolus]|nr:hypothetical protein GCM10010282_37220 [Streptomyces roseolus]
MGETITQNREAGSRAKRRASVLRTARVAETGAVVLAMELLLWGGRAVGNGAGGHGGGARTALGGGAAVEGDRGGCGGLPSAFNGTVVGVGVGGR